MPSQSKGRGKQGDAGRWHCPECSNLNYKFRDSCNKCGAARPGEPSGNGAAAGGGSARERGEKRKAVPEATPAAFSVPSLPKWKSGRQRVKQLTQVIVQHAKRRRLGEAQKVFKQLRDEGLEPSLLTYSAYLNAHVASGDIDGAEAVLALLKKSGLAANSVVYNTLLKGHAAAGATRRAGELLSEMRREGVAPDGNSVNAHLGCLLRTGGAEEALSALEAAGDLADFLSYKRAAQVLGRGLHLPGLALLRGRLQENAGGLGEAAGSAALAWLQLHRGFAAAMLGRFGKARAALERLEALGAKAAAAPEVHLAAKESGGPVGEKLGQSSFHEKSFEAEMQRLREAVAAGQAPTLSECFGRLFVFPQESEGRGGEAADRHLRALRRGFGLAAAEDAGLVEPEAIAKRLRRSFAGERLRWERLFPSQLPVKLEICSGFGEWAAAQAKAEAGLANWAALELRHDRCFAAFTRAALGGLENLCVLAGDGSEILKRHLAAGSVSHAFVNFPEPPQTSMRPGAESHLHLLTEDFFAQVHEVLCEGGLLTVLHDEREYCLLLLRTVAALNARRQRCFASVKGLQGRGMGPDDFEEVPGGLLLYHGLPGRSAGHAVRVKSYFDELWQRKGKDRFFFVLSKAA